MSKNLTLAIDIGHNIECAFCDSEEDMAGYDTSKMAHAIFIGICKALDINSQEELKPILDSVYYTVVKGDTLLAISKRYGVGLEDIVSLNNIPNVNLITPGQKIRVK